MISLIIKILIGLAGLAAALFYLIIGLLNRSRSYVRTGWMVGLATLVIIAPIMVIEFLLRDK